jgi:hypothetical protein
LSIPLKKGTFWKVTKNTIDTKNEKLFSSTKLRSKSLSRVFALKRKNHAPTKKKKGQNKDKLKE